MRYLEGSDIVWDSTLLLSLATLISTQLILVIPRAYTLSFKRPSHIKIFILTVPYEALHMIVSITAVFKAQNPPHLLMKCGNLYLTHSWALITKYCHFQCYQEWCTAKNSNCLIRLIIHYLRIKTHSTLLNLYLRWAQMT